MTRSAFILGGTGLIGRALVPLLVENGYDVTVATRAGASTETFRHVQVDRSIDEEFDGATSGDHDLFVDIVAFNEAHGRQLLGLEGRVGSVVFVSSAAVYSDPDGKSWLESDIASPIPIREGDPVVPPVPDGSDYAGGKVAIENALLASDLPVSVLRPGAIFGPGDRASREWHFVKRVVDGRRKVLVADNGENTFHHVSSFNVAEMIVAAGERPGHRVVNSGDPEPRNIRAICETVADVMAHEWDIIDIGPAPDEIIGVTPWSTAHPVIMDVSVAHDDLGWRAAIPYETSIDETCNWLIEETKGRAWDEALPKAAKYYGQYFDYGGEDDFLAQRLRQ